LKESANPGNRLIKLRYCYDRRGGHRERGKAEGDGKFFLHGTIRPTRAFEAGALSTKAPSVSVQYDTGEEKFCCLN
jgi:hypothetical protein